jgi:hypothetical protein
MDFLLKPEEYDGFFRQEFCRVNHKTTTIRELILERANRRRNLIKELYFLGRIISPETIEKLRENRWESEEEKRNILAIIEGEMRRITIKETKRGGKETMGIVEDDMPSPRKDIIYSHLEATGEGREKEGVVYCKEVKYKGEWKIAHRYTGTFLKKSIDEYEEWINQNF